MLIDEEVGEILVSHLDVDRDQLLASARLDEDLGLDSLALTEALLVLEDDLAISIPDSVQARLRTFGDLVDVVASQLPAAASCAPASGRRQRA